MALLVVLWLFGLGVARVKASDHPTCDCCDEYTLHAYAGELNRHCLPASLLRKKQDIIVGEALDGSPSVPEEALSILCASALCRSSVLRYWARVRGCSESSSWKRFGFAWAAAKVRCMRLPQEREPQDGARYQVLMQATFGQDGQQAKDAANLELASTAIKQALLGSLWRAPQALTAPREGLRVQVAMAAYGPPIAGPVTFEMATPETTSCPQVVTTFPWPGEVNVKPGLDYIVLHFDRCVRLHEKETATLFGSGTPDQATARRLGEAPPGFELPSLSDAVCRHDLVSASLPVSEVRMPGRTLIFRPDRDLKPGCCYTFHLDMEAVNSCSSQTPLCEDLQLDFCVKWPSPKATTWLHDDRFLQVVFNAAVNLNGTSRRIQLRAGPEADVLPEGAGPGQEAPERVTALFTLQPSKRLYWMYGDGNFTSGVGTVDDNMDGTGSLLEQPVYCAHVPHGQAAGIQTCEDHRSFEVDICEVEGNCPDKEKLPCGMILEADFQAGMAISRGVVSRTMTQTHHTRGCHPPELLKTLRISGDGKTLFFSWSQPAEVADPRAMLSLCHAGEPMHCILEGLAIGDPAVTPCIAGPASCSEWSVDLQHASSRPCGTLELRIERGAVREVGQQRESKEAHAAMEHPVSCSSVAFDEGPRSGVARCFLVHDGLMLDKGPSTPNLLSDLGKAHMDVSTVSLADFWRRVSDGPRSTPCVIIPKVAKKFWLGHERLLFDYVLHGGQLYIAGGHFNRRALHDVFGFNLQHAHSGNVQYLQDGHRSVAPQCSDKWLKMLPVLNAMTAVKLPPRGQAFGHTVTATGLYSAQETSSSFNSFGLVDLQLGGGKAAYFAFDWHDDVSQERRAWAITFAMLVECNADQVEVSEMPVDSRARGWQAPAAPAPRMQKVSYEGSHSASGMPYQSMQFGPGNRQVPNPGKHREGASWPRRLQEEGQALDAWEEASLTGDPVEPDLEVSIALTCPFRPDSSDRLSEADASSCDGIQEKMLENLVTPESGFYAALAPDMSLHLLHFAPPHIIRALSDCPPIERIEESVLQMNAACNFRDARGDASEGLYTSSTAFLRLHLFQSQLGVEMLSQHLQKQVCRRPLCRGYAEILRQRVRGCPEDAGHKGVIARVARAVDTTMASCLEVHSASHGDATHSEVSSGGGALAGVWSSDMSEKNHVLISGIDTGSAAEMRAVEAAVGRILADELQLPLFAFEERGQSFADIFDPLLGGPNVFTVTESRLRVAAQLTPLPSGEPFDESVGRFNEPKQEIPVQQNAYFAEQHNLQMLAIQPRWNEQGIDPSRLRIRIIFEEVVTKDDPSAVIRIFPVALRDICSSLQPDDELQWQMFPADTGLGSLEPASGGSGAGPLDSVPVGFVCHVIAAGDDVQVLASGEVLQVELSQPLLRNTEYVVLLPPRIVKAAMGSTTFPGALWEGWPSEEGQDNQEYVFTTGTPKVSNARLSIAVSCSSEEECERQRRLVSEQGMEDLASRASCFAAWFRCNQDPVAQKHCEIPDQSTQWCDPHGSWAPSWSPPRKKQDVQLSSVPDQAVSEVQSIYLPSWVYIVSLAAWVQGTFATLRAAWWVSDLYTQSRDFDPYVAQGSRSLPLKACAVSMAIPLLVGIIGAVFAVPVFRIAVHGLWSQGGSNQQGALVDAERLHHQLAAAFTVCFCASEAFTAVFAYSLIARFKSWVADKGQLISISSLCCAAAGAAGAACGWVASSGVRHMTHPSLGLALGIVVLLAGVLLAHILSLTIMPGAIFGLLWEMPGIGDILSHAVKYQVFHWRKWFDHGRESGGSWSDFVLLIADIEVNEGFVQSMLNMGMDDGHLFIKFYCSETPQDVSATRSQAVQWEGADDGLVQKFDGEDIFVNFTNPLALLRVDVMFQEETANRPECVATTIWDPWCANLLNKYFSNFALCDARSDHSDFWNPKDVFHPDGRPVDGVFLELELNLTRHRTDCGPEMGLLRFHATHMGGFGSKRQSRLHPWEKPEKLLALGDTIPGRNNIYWRRAVVDVRKADFQDGRFHRAAEEEEEEQRRMAHRQELRHQLEHQQHQQTPRPRSPRSPSWRQMPQDQQGQGQGGRLPHFVTFSGASGSARPVAVQASRHEDDCSPSPSLMSDFLICSRRALKDE